VFCFTNALLKCRRGKVIEVRSYKISIQQHVSVKEALKKEGKIWLPSYLVPEPLVQFYIRIIGLEHGV